MGASTSSLSTMTGPTVAALSILHLLGVNCMYGLVWRNGYIKALLDLKNNGPHVLPGSDNPILTLFTGIMPLDKVLTLAGVMFANVSDGTSPQLSLYGFYFAGQLVAIFTVIVIEGLREGNQGSIMTLYPLWGCAMQGLGYGFTMPLFCISHLLYSKTAVDRCKALAESLRIKNRAALSALPVSLIVGYIIPSILMAVPISSNTLHQWFGGLWQGFPVWVTLAMWLFSKLPRYEPLKGNCSIENRYVLHTAYTFAFAATSLSHIATIGTIGARHFFLSWFSPLAREALTFSEVFVPPNFQNPGPMRSMAVGILNFFQYDQYVGSIAALAWASALRVNARKTPMKMKDWAWLTGELLGVGAIAGPAGALVALMWNRDNAVLSDEEI